MKTTPTPRPLAELLEILLNELPDYTQIRRGSGLCALTLYHLGKGTIIKCEYVAIQLYISSNAPINMEYFPYKWPPGEIAPRVEWLKEQITLLKSEKHESKTF